MRLSQDKLEIAVAKGVSTGNSTVAIHENQKAVHIDQDQSKFVTDDGAVYAEKHGWSVVSTVRKALLERASGQKVLTLREADVIARQKIDPNSPFLVRLCLVRHTATSWKVSLAGWLMVSKGKICGTTACDGMMVCVGEGSIEVMPRRKIQQGLMRY